MIKAGFTRNASGKRAKTAENAGNTRTTTTMKAAEIARYEPGMTG
jgi:hypothetical protein